MEIELVFIPSPGIGHIRSTTAIAKLLVDSNDRLSVTLIIIPSQFSNDDNNVSDEDRLRYYRLSAAGDQSDADPEQNFISYIESQKPHVRAAVSEVSKRSSDSRRRIAGIVVDMFCTSMIDVADEFNLPVYVFYTSNASYLGLQFHVQSLYDEKKVDLSELSSEEEEMDVPTLTRRFPVKCLPSVMLNKEWFPYVLARATSFRRAKGILVNSLAEMEPYALKFFSGVNGNNTPPVYAVGPVLDLDLGGGTSGDDARRKEILSWLDEQPPSSVLFLCFGSMGGFSEEQVREIALALERSGHRFLWSLRPASALSMKKVTNSPPRGFANLEEILPQGFLDRTVEIGKIISWAPQVAVLENPAIGGFVTHCGWNSILESLWFGVPTAAWPIYAEQQFNAFQMVEELGLAVEVRKDYRRDFLVVEPELVTAEKIEKAIKCVMEENSDIKKKVKEMRDKFRMALMDGGSSQAAMGRFVQDVVDNIS